MIEAHSRPPSANENIEYSIKLYLDLIKAARERDIVTVLCTCTNWNETIKPNSTA